MSTLNCFLVKNQVHGHPQNDGHPVVGTLINGPKWQAVSFILHTVALRCHCQFGTERLRLRSFGESRFVELRSGRFAPKAALSSFPKQSQYTCVECNNVSGERKKLFLALLKPPTR